MSSIFFSKNHWKHPFSYSVEGQSKNKELSLKQKVSVVVLTIFAGVLIPFVGGVLTFYALTAKCKADNMHPSTIKTKDTASKILMPKKKNESLPVKTESPPVSTPPKKEIQLPTQILEKILSYLEDHPPTNAIEFIIYLMIKQPEAKNWIIEKFGLCDQHFLYLYLERENTQGGGTPTTTNLLMSLFFGQKNECVCLSPGGGDIQGKIAYTPEMENFHSLEEVVSFIKGTLNSEITKNPASRPNKIFIPMSWRKDGKGHATLLIVEPSSTELHQARITMINTHGNALMLFRDFEIAVMRAAKEVYHSASTTVIRNEKCIYTTAFSCTYDCIRIARQLMDASDAQAVVKKGLSRATQEDDKALRLECGNRLLEFYQRYMPQENKGP